MGLEDKDGNLSPDQGSLFLVTSETLDNPTPVITPVNISNGMTWNYANNKFYYIDTPTDQVVQYDYDNKSGKITNPKTVFDVTKHQDRITGHPDGMTIDKDDNLWIALYGGGAVVKVDPRVGPEGKILDVIAIPAQYVTSVCWGGQNLKTLFVTTSRRRLDEVQRKEQPFAGALFAVKNLKTRGRRPIFSRIIGEILRP